MTTTDQMGSSISISFPPRRIISLVPSQTELLFDLGLENNVIGITKFCIHPREKVKSKTKIGGTKKFNFKAIEALNPDLIIGNKEENYKEGIQRLQEKYPVWMSDIFTLEDALHMMQKIGEITERAFESEKLVSDIKQRFLNIDSSPIGSAAYFIWKDPLMVAGNSTFLNEILKLAGFSNAFEQLPRYPQITEGILDEASPDFILLSSEPYPFSEKHVAYFNQFCKNSKVLLVDGEMFSWYGSRLLKLSIYLEELRRKLPFS